MLFSRIMLFLASSVAYAENVRRATSPTDSPTGTVDPSTIKDCTYWVNPTGGETCASIISDLNPLLTLEQFQCWNPSLGAECTLREGYSYCVEKNWGIPEPTPTPITSKSTLTYSTVVTITNTRYSTLTFVTTPPGPTATCGSA
ncbi:hypothetical protein B0O99DRAFT_614000 [Bisporella sp. PMI_857]|nr:hypothetical protein B0O99DRAFT_614000 [Bisporella sp. PMI_857]